jgi:hypothetical protein
MQRAPDPRQEVPERSFRQVARYFLILNLVTGLSDPDGGIAQIPVQFILKDTLKLGPRDMAFAQFVIAIPLSVSFLFGFVRDRWSPFARRDRGYFLLFGPLTALVYLALPLGRRSVLVLVVSMFAANLFSLFVSASLEALTTLVGQEMAMTGRLGALTQLVDSGLTASSFVLGGWLQSHTSPDALFRGLAALSLLILPLGLWRPRSVYAGHDRAAPQAHTTGHEILRFARHRPLWPAMLVWLLWQFNPCFATPLFFTLTDRLGATSNQYGWFMGLFYLSLVPAPIAYGFLCKRVPLSRLLWWSTALAIPQVLPLLFLKTPTQSLLLAPLLGLLGGLPTCAYYDLILRSCPKGLEGAAMMMSGTMLFVAIRFGDILGSWLYDRGGFALAAWVTTAVYACIPVVLAFVPRWLTAHPDGAGVLRPGDASGPRWPP